MLTQGAPAVGINTMQLCFLLQYVSALQIFRGPLRDSGIVLYCICLMWFCRAAVERQSLQFARRLLVETSSFGGSMEALVKAAAACDSAYVDELTEPREQ